MNKIVILGKARRSSAGAKAGLDPRIQGFRLMVCGKSDFAASARRRTPDPRVKRESDAACAAAATLICDSPFLSGRE
jgi:hypothetical protein